MRSLKVVVIPPFFNDLPGFSKVADFPKQDMNSIEEALIRLSSRKFPVA